MPVSDLIHVVEATYDIGTPDAEWMRHLARALKPLLDDGLGVLSVVLAPDNLGTLRGRGAPVCAGMSADVCDALVRASAKESPDVLAAVYGRPVNTMHREFGDRFELLSTSRHIVNALGIVDSMAITAFNPDGTALCVATPLRAFRTLSKQTVQRWSRVAAHLASGLRLRSISATSSSVNAAVLAPNGKVVHAEEDAKSRSDREALRQAAVFIDKARGRLRRSDPDQALAQWTSLVSGRFTLVDEFDSDGRRFVIARRNEPHAAVPGLLSRRERQVVAFRSAGHGLKLIAYELGVSDSTVSRALACARHKLKARDDLELVRIVRARAHHGVAETSESVRSRSPLSCTEKGPGKNA